MELGNSKTKEKLQKLDDAAENGVDLISCLPREVLSRIFSFLPTEDVFRKVSFVSKKWKLSCHPLSILDFDFERFSKNLGLRDQEDRFAEFVERMIVRHEGMHVDKIRLSIDISTFGAQDSEIIGWFSSAININLTALDLDIRDGGEIDEYDGRNILHDLLASLHNITMLTLTSPYLEVIPPEKALEALAAGKVHKLLPAPQLSNVLHLTLKYSALLKGFPSLASFLRFSPRLETLCIDVNRKSVGFDDSYSIDPIEGLTLESYFPSDGLLHVKKVQIKGFEGRGSEMFFLSVLMNKALALEDITIHKDAMNSRYESVKCDGDQTKLKLLKEEQEETIVDLLALHEGSSTRARILLL